MTNAKGQDAEAMDDVLFPNATAGTLYIADTNSDTVYALKLTGLNPDIPIVSLGSFHEVALVNPARESSWTRCLPASARRTVLTSFRRQDRFTDLNSPHGLDFAATGAAEPSTWR